MSAFDDLVEALSTIEERFETGNIPLDALPIRALQEKLEDTWNVEADKLILPKTVTADMHADAEYWHYPGATGEPGWTNGWRSYNEGVGSTNGTGTRRARFFKDNFGMVHLAGIAGQGTNGASMFTMPVGYRPNQDGVINDLAFPCNNSTGAYQTIIVNEDGTVIPFGVGGAGSWIYLNTIYYRAEH